MSAPTESWREGVDPVVVLEEASRWFGKRCVLSGVNLAVKGGEVVGLAGPNGGGKSTLLFLMAGLLRPSSGRVRVCGVDAWRLSLGSAGRVGLVTARPGLYPLLTGRENLHHFLGLFGLTPQEVDARAAPLAQALELDRLDDRVAQLSTGMQQKLSLIRALLLAPKLLLFDEPTAHLDPIAAHALHTEVRRRADQGLACVLVTHDLTSAESICDRVLLVNGGIKRELTFLECRPPEVGPVLAAWRQELAPR